MKNLKKIKVSTTHQKNKKQLNDSGNHHADNKVSDGKARSNNENGHILEQMLSDMAWYG